MQMTAPAVDPTFFPRPFPLRSPEAAMADPGGAPAPEDRPATDEAFMRAALAEAREAERRGEVPIGAVVVRNGRVIAWGGNRVRQAQDPSAHAELVAIRAAARALGNYRLPGCDLYVTVEPCVMCAGALVQARIRRLVYGAPEPKFGGLESRVRLARLGLPHRMRVSSGVLADEARRLLQEFFRSRREGGSETRRGTEVAVTGAPRKRFVR